MPTWIGQKEERFDGCLMVLNIGNHNFSQLPVEYVNALKERISLAIADGWLIIWAFDTTIDEPQIPDDCDTIEGTTHLRMVFDVCGRRDVTFALLPDARLKELKAIEQTMRDHPSFRWSGPFAIGGAASIASQNVLMPITEL